MNRRNFIKNMAVTAGSLSLLPSTSFASGFSDYKAIVIVSLNGGNDAMNMFPPIAENTHVQYESIRGNLAISWRDLYIDDNYGIDANGHFTGTEGNDQPYYKVDSANPTAESNDILMYTKGSYHTNAGLGINALMPELASLYTKGVLSIVSNVGTLVEPTTKAQIANGSANLPIFLFAHNHQSLAVATTQADILGKTGWAGRLADNWRVNGSLGLNISYSGPERTLTGRETSALAMGTSEPASYKSLTSGDKLEELLIRFNDNTTNTNHLDRFYNLRNKNTAQLSTLLTSAWANVPDFSGFSAKNSYGKDLFTSYEDDHKTKLGMLTHHGLHKNFSNQLEATAKMMKISKDDLGHKRQIFYVRGIGYDSHSDQVQQHSRNLRTVSLGISDFYKALEEMGMAEDVLIVSNSEFGRTLKNNGDGTDHGWGGHNFMLSGDPAFNGGNVFGEVMSDLSLDGVNAHTDRARIIPTTSIEQMLAPALKWFGVEHSLIMSSILPNLTNFTPEGGDAESSFLQDVFTNVT